MIGSFTRNFEAALFGNVLGVSSADVAIVAGVALFAGAAVFLVVSTIRHRRLPEAALDAQV